LDLTCDHFLDRGRLKFVEDAFSFEKIVKARAVARPALFGFGSVGDRLNSLLRFNAPRHEVGRG
jgi:hypothetical protein